MGVAKWLSKFRRKEIEAVTEECKHEWHNVGDTAGVELEYDMVYELKEVKEEVIYCPKCDETEFVTPGTIKILERKAEVKQEYEARTGGKECKHDWAQVGEQEVEWFGDWNGYNLYEYERYRVVDYRCLNCRKPKRIRKEKQKAFEEKIQMYRKYKEWNPEGSA